MKGAGLGVRFGTWCGRVFLGLMLVGALLIMTMGKANTGSLYATAAITGGDAGHLTIKYVPVFFQHLTGNSAGSIPTTATPRKVPNCTAAQKQATPSLCA